MKYGIPIFPFLQVLFLLPSNKKAGKSHAEAIKMIM